jgi:hypothetical protein
MNGDRVHAAGTRDLVTAVLEAIPRLSPSTFGILFAAFFFTPYWVALNIVHSLWQPDILETRDFNAFYSASMLTLQGDPALVYDRAANLAMQEQVVGDKVIFLPWFYPPIMLLFVAPLALVPYYISFALWVVTPLTALAVVVRRYTGHVLASAAFVLFPGTVQSALSGQNGLLSALIIAGGFVNLERNPLVGGAVLGLLSYKPHIAATVYAALLFGRYWRALGAALLVSAMLALMSLIAFGPDVWFGFLRETDVARVLLEDGKLRWSFMATVFGAARIVGISIPVAYALQAVVTCAALCVLVAVWRRGDDIPLEQRVAVLVTVVPLMTPYAFSYDLVMMGLALVWLGQTAWETGFRRGEALVFALAWVIAPVGWVIADWTNVLVTPAVIIALLVVLMLRIRRPGPIALQQVI